VDGVQSIRRWRWPPSRRHLSWPTLLRIDLFGVRTDRNQCFDGWALRIAGSSKLRCDRLSVLSCVLLLCMVFISSDLKVIIHRENSRS
jgi:hypothetical protein